MTHFLPTTAIVRSAGVSARTGSGRNHSTTYGPEITYEYDVAGKHYTSSSVLPLGQFSTSDRNWAHDIVRPFKAGRQSTAWYNPADPSEAFIAREYSFLAPTTVLFSTPFVVIFPGAVGVMILSTWLPANLKRMRAGGLCFRRR